MPRQFSNWIDAYVEHTAGVKSPESFRRWAAISAVASALQRKTWMRFGKQNTFPNMYVLLIGPPGVGKSNAIKFVRLILRRLQNIKLTPTRITAAAFYIELESAKFTSIDTSRNEMYRYHALTAMIDEFSVFVRPGNTELMADLADLFDCPDPFESKTKHAGENIFPNSWFNLIGGATPKYLREAWSNTILDEGFPSRCLIVYSDETIDAELFDEDDGVAEAEDLRRIKDLSVDLSEIAKLRGKFTWDPPAQKLMEDWYGKGLPPIPRDPRLEHYLQRRPVHVAKLCMIVSAAKRDDQEILVEDLEEARELLITAEHKMPDAISSLGASPLRDQIILAKKLVHKYCLQHQKPCPEKAVRHALLNEVDPIRIRSLINEMLAAGWIRQGDLELPEGSRLFIPGEDDE